MKAVWWKARGNGETHLEAFQKMLPVVWRPAGQYYMKWKKVGNGGTRGGGVMEWGMIMQDCEVMKLAGTIPRCGQPLTIKFDQKYS